MDRAASAINVPIGLVPTTAEMWADWICFQSSSNGDKVRKNTWPGSAKRSDNDFLPGIGLSRMAKVSVTLELEWCVWHWAERSPDLDLLLVDLHMLLVLSSSPNDSLRNAWKKAWPLQQAHNCRLTVYGFFSILEQLFLPWTCLRRSISGSMMNVLRSQACYLPALSSASGSPPHVQELQYPVLSLFLHFGLSQDSPLNNTHIFMQILGCVCLCTFRTIYMPAILTNTFRNAVSPEDISCFRNCCTIRKSWVCHSRLARKMNCGCSVKPTSCRGPDFTEITLKKAMHIFYRLYALCPFDMEK